MIEGWAQCAMWQLRAITGLLAFVALASQTQGFASNRNLRDPRAIDDAPTDSVSTVREEHQEHAELIRDARHAPWDKPYLHGYDDEHGHHYGGDHEDYDTSHEDDGDENSQSSEGADSGSVGGGSVGGQRGGGGQVGGNSGSRGRNRRGRGFDDGHGAGGGGGSGGGGPRDSTNFGHSFGFGDQQETIGGFGQQRESVSGIGGGGSSRQGRGTGSGGSWGNAGREGVGNGDWNGGNTGGQTGQGQSDDLIPTTFDRRRTETNDDQVSRRSSLLRRDTDNVDVNVASRDDLF